MPVQSSALGSDAPLVGFSGVNQEAENHRSCLVSRAPSPAIAKDQLSKLQDVCESQFAIQLNYHRLYTKP